MTITGSYGDLVKRTSVSHLKAHLSAELKAVKAGETIVVVDRDHPVARLVPLEEEKARQVREPLRAFDFGRPTPLVPGGSLEPLFQDRGRR
jgi:prevent-host-death family protein